uniref:Uncharacterized protein n=1 Tax=Rhizophora mucronata TaxID=61149 RepID=A0A2P2P2D3_RHIMU
MFHLIPLCFFLFTSWLGYVYRIYVHLVFSLFVAGRLGGY